MPSSPNKPPPSGPREPPEHPRTPDPSRKEETQVLERPKTNTPKLYKVIFHNDDFTTMEFVVMVLMQFFQKTETEATHVMLTVHRKGSAVAGVYTRDIAESKVEKVHSFARENGMPLMLTTEPET
jgi:ATP-dependent Clp protease adaptor protein ClpS